MRRATQLSTLVLLIVVAKNKATTINNQKSL